MLPASSVASKILIRSGAIEKMLIPGTFKFTSPPRLQFSTLVHAQNGGEFVQNRALVLVSRISSQTLFGCLVVPPTLWPPTTLCPQLHHSVAIAKPSRAPFLVGPESRTVRAGA